MDLVAESLLAWKIVAVLVWFAAFFAAERLLPAAPRPAPLDEPGGGGLRLARNLGLSLVNFAISPLIVVPVSLLASEIALAWRPEAWQGWPALLVDIVVLDFL
ncbi:MAG: sterol desaturase family protein, partial [Kiloniellales bacterium]